MKKKKKRKTNDVKMHRVKSLESKRKHRTNEIYLNAREQKKKGKEINVKTRIIYIDNV